MAKPNSIQAPVVEVVGEPNPGTPDEEVSPMRLRGRMAARLHLEQPPLRKQDRTDWWLGWYDVQLERFYRKAVSE